VSGGGIRRDGTGKMQARKGSVTVSCAGTAPLNHCNPERKLDKNN
jgi:hypothetical protein